MRNLILFALFAFLAISANAGPAFPGDPDAPSASHWMELGDTTLSRLQQEVLGSNLDVQAARARVQAARSDRTRAVLDYTPSVTAAGLYARRQLSTTGFPGAPAEFPEESVWEAGVVGSWEIDVFGRIRSNVRAQDAFVDVAREDLRDVQVTLSAELARAFFELRGAQEQLEVARRNAENQQRTLQVTRDRLEAGRGNALDTDRAQAQLSSTLASIPGREVAVAAAQHRIGVLVGRSPVEVARELEQPAPFPRLPEIAAISDLREIIRNRPDVAAAERRTEAQRALVGVAQASYLPRITLAGAAGYSAPEFEGFGDGGTFRYSVGPVITWPLLDIGRVKAEADAARAREEAARAEHTQALLTAEQDIETALTRYERSHVRVERLAEASAASERAAELARLRFREGIIDFLQVLDAERTLLEAQDRLAEGRTESAFAYAALYRARGGR